MMECHSEGIKKSEMPVTVLFPDLNIFVEREKVGTLFFLLSGGEHSSFYSQRDSGSIRATRKVSSPLEISGKKRKWGTHFNPDEFAKPPSISVFFAQLDFLFFLQVYRAQRSLAD